jgi:hypothetical protein
VISAVRALSLAADAEALPRVEELADLYRYGFVPRRGQFLLIAGQPGAGKSAFALWWIARMKLRTLYFMADSDEFTTITRIGAILTGLEVDDIGEAIESGNTAFIEDDLDECNIQFCFDSGPTLQDIADEIDAYVELWDAFPELICIDNAMNVEAEMGEEHAGLRLVFKETHRMARETGAAVVMLHHVREEGSPRRPPPRSGIQGKTSQLPERILTVAFDSNENTFMFAPVKNRSGKQDPTGETFFRLTAEPERSSFRKYTPPLIRGNNGAQTSAWVSGFSFDPTAESRGLDY